MDTFIPALITNIITGVLALIIYIDSRVTMAQRDKHINELHNRLMAKNLPEYAALNSKTMETPKDQRKSLDKENELVMGAERLRKSDPRGPSIPIS